MFYQFQNEIIATIAITTLIIVYIISRKRNPTKKEEQKALPQDKEPLISNKDNAVEDTKITLENGDSDFEIIQDETPRGTQEGNFDFVQTHKKQINKHNIKTISKRDLVKHGKITKQNFAEFSGSRVLVAEDNFINQKVLTGLLAGSGIEIILANNGQEALDILETDNDFFMILMDAHMPIVDGFEATKIIRKNSNYSHIVIVALSGDTAPDDIKKMKNSGMDETLEKPLKMESLYDMMYIYHVDEKHENYIEIIMTQELHGDIGLEVCGGDEEFYREILNEFITDYEDSAQKLHTLLHSERLNEADKLLLDILGITANIGAVTLNSLARDIKSALSDTNEKSYLTLIDEYKSHLDTLICDIKDYI